MECPFCANKFHYGLDVEESCDSKEAASGIVDLSDDKSASFLRWLGALKLILYAASASFVIDILLASFSLMTCISAFVFGLSAVVLVSGVSRGALWARISTYAITLHWAVFAVLGGDACGIVAGVRLWLYMLGSGLLLLPKVSRKLKELGKASGSTRAACLLCWGLVVLSIILFVSAPNAPGLSENDIAGISSIPKPLRFLVFLGIGSLLSYVVYHFIAVADLATGGAVAEAKVVSTKNRNASCPKCGQAVIVPDTDDNDAIVCPRCSHWFYPFGRSHLATLAFYLGLFSVLIIPAPFALAVGICALRDIKKNRGKHGLQRAWVGIIMGGIFALPLGIITGCIFLMKSKRKAVRCN